MELLASFTPSDEVMDLAREILREEWDTFCDKQKKEKVRLNNQIAKLERNIERTTDSLLSAGSESVKKRLEARIEEMEFEQSKVCLQLTDSALPFEDFERALRTVFETIENLKKWRFSS